MSKLNVDFIYNGIDVKVHFVNKINILTGYSGTGKTLLLNAVDLYCLNNNIKCRLCNYNDANLAPDKLISICEENEVVLLDNADLYLTDHILESIQNHSDTIIISIKDTQKLNLRYADNYIVEYNDLKLTTRLI